MRFSFPTTNILKRHRVKPSSPSPAAKTAFSNQGGGGGGLGGYSSHGSFYGAVLLCVLALVTVSAIVVTVKLVLVRVSKLALAVECRVRGWCRCRGPPPEHPKLALVAESHLSASKGERARLREKFRVTNERHPELRDLTTAKHTSCEEGEEEEEEEEGGGQEGRGEPKKGGDENEGGEEEGEKEEEEVDALQTEVAEALSESRRLAREDLQATRTSASDLRDALRSMREKLATADEAEGKSHMKQELLEEIKALVEADIGVATLCDGDGAVGMVKLHALMAKRFWDRCEHAEREAKTLNDKVDKDLAAILRSKPGEDLSEVSVEQLNRSKPGEDLSEVSVEQLIAAIEATREKEARALRVLVLEAVEDTVAAKSRVQGYEERFATAEVSLRDEKKREMEDKKKSDADLSDLREYVSRAPALLQEISEVKQAVLVASRMKRILVRRERELKDELENP